MRNILPTAILLLSLAGCLGKDVSPQDAPKVALEQVMDSLYSNHNYDSYINAVYDEEGQSVLPRSVAYDMLRQHVEAVEVQKGFVSDCIAHTVTFHSDTLATVYYDLVFADGKSESFSQKMVCVGSHWKLVVRN